MIEKMVEIGILFDFYGKLLTDKQFQSVDLYYMQDLSLGEIGERIGISRQSVFDTLKRAEQNLYRYEEDLRLVEKFKENQNDLKTIIKLSKDIDQITDNIDIRKISKEIKDICNKVIL